MIDDLPLRHSHPKMDNTSTLKRKADNEDGAKSKKTKKKWYCHYTGCTRQAQACCNKMCKTHYNETILRQSISNNLNQSNNDAQQGAIVLAGFCEHVNNTEIDRNIPTEEGTRNDAPTVSHHINSTINCVTANNTTVSNVELQTAAENIERQTDGEVNGRSASHDSIKSRLKHRKNPCSAERIWRLFPCTHRCYPLNRMPA